MHYGLNLHNFDQSSSYIPHELDITQLKTFKKDHEIMKTYLEVDPAAFMSTQRKALINISL